MATQIIATLSKKQPINVEVAQVFTVYGGSLAPGSAVGDEIRWDGAAWSPFSASKANWYDFSFAYGDLSVIPLVQAAAGKRILAVVLRVLMPFNDPSATLSVGDAVDQDRLISRDHVAVDEAASYESAPGYAYGSTTQVNLYKSTGTSTAGAGIVSVLMEK